MSFGAELVARALGLPDVPVRAFRRAVGAFLTAMAIFMPVTFGHGLMLYAQQEAQQMTHWVVTPLLHAVQQSVPSPNGATPTGSQP